MSKRLIYEEDAIDAVAEGLKRTFVEYRDVAEKLLNNVPSAQPEHTETHSCDYQRTETHESCTDCPLYDHDRHNCPRFNRVIPATIEAAKPRWIPVTERLPEEPFGCLVTVCDTDPVTLEDFENILPYFVGYDGEKWNDYEGDQCPFEVLAWIPLPEPYKEGQE